MGRLDEARIELEECLKYNPDYRKANEYLRKYKDMKISIIILTIPGREEYLRQTIEALCHQTLTRDLYEILIVWEGDEQPPRFLNEYPLKIKFVSNNRGRSAARNTGVKNVDTKLAMFLDDDLVSSPEVVEIHYRFHQQNPNPNLMAVGNVTWVNHPHFNGVMDWFEREGGFSIFHKLEDGKPSPQFLAGITSFKTDVVKRIWFDEGLTYEDHEFGYRFFRLGGRLIFLEKALADHIKYLDAESYYKYHVGCGYAVGNMFLLHPDFYWAPNQLEQAISLTSLENSIQNIIEIANSLTIPFRIQNRGSVNSILTLISTMAVTSGLRQYWREHYPNYESAEKVLLKGLWCSEGERAYAIQRATELCPTFPHCWMLAGMETKKWEEALSHFERTLELVPRFVTATIMYAQAVANKSKEKARTILFDFLNKYEETLERNTLRKCYLDFGKALSRWGRQDEAIELLRKAIEVEAWGTEEHSWIASAYFHLMNILIEMGRYSEAIEAGNCVLEYQPENAKATTLLSKLLMERNPEWACRLAKRARILMKHRPKEERIELSGLLRSIECRFMENNPVNCKL